MNLTLDYKSNITKKNLTIFILDTLPIGNIIWYNVWCNEQPMKFQERHWAKKAKLCAQCKSYTCTTDKRLGQLRNIEDQRKQQKQRWEEKQKKIRKKKNRRNKKRRNTCEPIPNRTTLYWNMRHIGQINTCHVLSSWTNLEGPEPAMSCCSSFTRAINSNINIEKRTTSTSITTLSKSPCSPTHISTECLHA